MFSDESSSLCLSDVVATAPAPPVNDYIPATSKAPVVKPAKKVSKVKTGKEHDGYGKPKTNERPQQLIIDDRTPLNKKKANIDRPQVKNVFPNIPVEQLSEEESSSEESSGECASRDFCVNYISEYDIYNQVFNSSLQNQKSPVIRRLRAKIADWTAEEIHKRNLAFDITGEIRLLRIVDASKQYNNRPAVRFYVSIVVRRTQISIIRRILALVFDKLQTECSATSTKQANWNDLVVIPL